MKAIHPDTEIVPYIRGELSTDERTRVGAHLEQCADCRRSARASAAILKGLARAIDEVREPEWGDYRNELRRKLKALEAGRGVARRRWWADFQRPVFRLPSLAMALAAVAVLAIAVVAHRRAGGPPLPEVDQLELQQELSQADVGLMVNYRVVENLDLLENYDVIEHLDELKPSAAKTHETPS